MTDLAHPSPADEARQGIRPATVAFGAVLLAALIALPYIAGALGMNCATARPASVTIDTLSHEGILEDQGKDPLGYFGGHGVPADQRQDSIDGRRLRRATRYD